MGVNVRVPSDKGLNFFIKINSNTYQNTTLNDTRKYRNKIRNAILWSDCFFTNVLVTLETIKLG